MKARTQLVGIALLLALLVPGCGPRPVKERPPKELTTSEKIRMAESLRAGGRLNEALELLAEVSAETPGNARLHSIQGEYLFLGGRYDPAVAALSKALEIDPYLTDARNWLGATLTQLERYPEAREQYERALKDPSYPSPQFIYLNLGTLYRKQGLDEEGIAAFRSAVQIDPKFHKAHLELGLALESMGTFDEALDELVVAEPSYRSDGEYWYRRGFLEFRLQRSNQALESLRRCLSVSPGSPSAAQARELMGVIQG